MAISSIMRFAFIVTGLLGIAGAAHAETEWERTHPSHDQVNERLEKQDARIKAEQREREASAARAAELRRQDHPVRTEEHGVAPMDHGH